MFDQDTERDVQQEIDQRVLYYATLGRDQLDDRIEMLDYEWDVERWLMAMSGGLSALAMLAGGLRKGRWTLMSGLFGAFLLSQPGEDSSVIRFLRSMGIRTRAEIEREKVTLMAIRGDMAVLRDELQDALSHAIHELETESEPTVSH